MKGVPRKKVNEKSRTKKRDYSATSFHQGEKDLSAGQEVTRKRSPGEREKREIDPGK